MAKRYTGTGFAARLKELRIAATLTQGELADRAGVSVRTIQGWEQGKEPDWAAVLLLAKALNKTPNDFQVANPQPPDRQMGRPPA